MLVVDNSSSAETTEALAPLRARLGDRLRVVREETPGLSRSRNTGAAAARAPVLAYLDDDARPAPGWLEALRDAFADDRVALAGGPIVGLWPDGIPAEWLPAGVEGYFSILDHGDRDLDDAELYGANWAVRSSVLGRLGGFDTRFGAGEGGLLAGEETEVAYRVAEAKAGRSRYVAAAAVGHRIAPGRHDEGWLVLRGLIHGLIIPHVAARFGTPSPADLLALARRAAADLSGFLLLAGKLDLDDALAAVSASHLPLPLRVRAARGLGTLAACTILLGESTCVLGDLELSVRPDHGRGLVRQPPPRAPGSPPQRLPVRPAHERAARRRLVTCFNLGRYLDEAVASVAARPTRTSRSSSWTTARPTLEPRPSARCRSGSRPFR